MAATARVEGDKIVISTAGLNLPTADFSALTSFIRSLPRATFNRPRRCWVCDATPGAAWRIINEQYVKATDGIYPLAERLQGVLDPSRIDFAGQPGICRTPGRKHQVEAYHFTLPREAAMLGMDMGTGKTLVAIQLAENWDCRTVLVLCPKSVIAVWDDEIAKHAATLPMVLLLTKGSTPAKVATADKWLSIHPERMRVIVVNYDTARMKAFAEWSCEQDWDLVILDESHRGKAPTGVTAKYLARLGRSAKRRLCLTGTPMPHSPMDIFSQFRFLDPGLFGTGWGRFRQRYAVMGGYCDREVVSYQNLEELQRLMGLITFQCGSEVLDLPETNDHIRRFELGAEARRHYEELDKNFMTRVRMHFANDPRTDDELRQEVIENTLDGIVTVPNALVKLLRLQQLTSGYLQVESLNAVAVSVDAGKAVLLAELLEDIGPHERAVVFCKFTPDVDTVREVAESLGRGCGVIDGRYNDYRAWKAGQCDTLAVQIQSGSLGIDLTESRYAIYYSMGFSLGDYLQSRKRIHRPGQGRPCHYYHLLARGTIDEAVLGAIRKKEEIVNAVLSNLKGA